MDEKIIELKKAKENTNSNTNLQAESKNQEDSTQELLNENGSLSELREENETLKKNATELKNQEETLKKMVGLCQQHLKTQAEQNINLGNSVGAFNDSASTLGTDLSNSLNQLSKNEMSLEELSAHIAIVNKSTEHISSTIINHFINSINHLKNTINKIGNHEETNDTEKNNNLLHQTSQENSKHEDPLNKIDKKAKEEHKEK
jgi:hypothetical protein